MSYTLKTMADTYYDHMRIQTETLANNEYRSLRAVGYGHYEAVERVAYRYSIWLDHRVKEEIEMKRQMEAIELQNKRQAEEARKKQTLVEVKEKASVMEAKKYILIKAESAGVEYLTQKELDALLENPPLYDIEEFLSAADVLKGLGNQMLWRKGQAMLAKFEIQNPKPKEKAWTLPRE
jgi:16S rRNA C967 or C1407 C5-methylase (RsmB/RsmF family)